MAVIEDSTTSAEAEAEAEEERDVVGERPVPTDPPTDSPEVLFHEARQRRRRRWLLSGLVVVVVVLAVGVGWLVAGRGDKGSAVPPSVTGSQPATATAATQTDFTARPVLCYAVAYDPAAAAGVTASSPSPATAIPACGSSYTLTSSRLGIVPDPRGMNGFQVNPNVPSDPQYADVPSTARAADRPGTTVLLPDATLPSHRYVLGPAGLTRADIASARPTVDSTGAWSVLVTLTPSGAMAWDRLAQDQFHAIIGFDVNGQVISAPITQPTQSRFISFDGQLQISGAFTEHQAKMLAGGL